jgi:hypothetical protein
MPIAHENFDVSAQTASRFTLDNQECCLLNGESIVPLHRESNKGIPLLRHIPFGILDYGSHNRPLDESSIIEECRLGLVPNRPRGETGDGVTVSSGRFDSRKRYLARFPARLTRI